MFCGKWKKVPELRASVWASETFEVKPGNGSVVLDSFQIDSKSSSSTEQFRFASCTQMISPGTQHSQTVVLNNKAISPLAPVPSPAGDGISAIRSPYSLVCFQDSGSDWRLFVHSCRQNKISFLTCGS